MYDKVRNIIYNCVWNNNFIALNPNIDVIVGAGIGSGILLVTVIIGIAVCVCCFFWM